MASPVLPASLLTSAYAIHWVCLKDDLCIALGWMERCLQIISSVLHLPSEPPLTGRCIAWAARTALMAHICCLSLDEWHRLDLKVVSVRLCVMSPAGLMVSTTARPPT
jgi:hypothetical protein